jgi:hypothetical protein
MQWVSSHENLTWRRRDENLDVPLVAEIWGVAAAAVVGAVATTAAANKAAGAQTAASNSAIGEQQREFNQTQANEAPFVAAGTNALGLEQQYLSGNTSGFENSPDYQFAVSQGEKASQAGAAANGNLWGGGQTADAISLGQGLATQYANNYWNKISGVANQGQASAGTLANAGQQNANAISGQYNNIGQANASSYVAGANSLNNALGQGSNLYGQYLNSSSYNTPSPNTISSGGAPNIGSSSLDTSFNVPAYQPTSVGGVRF